jgi:hypothetical protein
MVKINCVADSNLEIEIDHRSYNSLQTGVCTEYVLNPSDAFDRRVQFLVLFKVQAIEELVKSKFTYNLQL